MVKLEEQDRRFVREVLSATKYVIEENFRRSAPLEVANEVILDFAVRIERLRIMLAPGRPGRVRFYEEELASRVHKELSSIVRDKRFNEIAGLKYRNRFGGSERIKNLESERGVEIQRRIQSLSHDLAPLGDILVQLIDFIEISDVSRRPKKEQLELLRPAELRRSIPSQKIAPLEVDVVSGRLVQIPRKIVGELEDQNNIAKAVVALIKSGSNIVEELNRSNCDRRLTDLVLQLQTQIESRENVIQLGLTNMTCDSLCNQFAAELPDVVVGLLNAHVRGVDILLSQFPEWNKFLENAHSANITDDEVQEVRKNVQLVAAKLEEDSELVDPQVPRSLRHLTELVRTPSKSGKRFAFAILRSLENIVSRLYLFGVEFFEETLKHTMKTGSRQASRAIVTAFLGIALYGAGILQPLATSVKELNWVKSTTEQVQKMVKELAKD